MPDEKKMTQEEWEALPLGDRPPIYTHPRVFWHIEPDGAIVDGHDGIIGHVYDSHDAEFVIHAVNTHHSLVDACRDAEAQLFEAVQRLEGRDTVPERQQVIDNCVCSIETMAKAREAASPDAFPPEPGEMT